MYLKSIINTTHTNNSVRFLIHNMLVVGLHSSTLASHSRGADFKTTRTSSRSINRSPAGNGGLSIRLQGTPSGSLDLGVSGQDKVSVA